MEQSFAVSGTSVGTEPADRLAVGSLLGVHVTLPAELYATSCSSNTFHDFNLWCSTLACIPIYTLTACLIELLRIYFEVE